MLFSARTLFSLLCQLRLILVISAWLLLLQEALQMQVHHLCRAAQDVVLTLSWNHLAIYLPCRRARSSKSEILLFPHHYVINVWSTLALTNE